MILFSRNSEICYVPNPEWAIIVQLGKKNFYKEPFKLIFNIQVGSKYLYLGVGKFYIYAYKYFSVIFILGKIFMKQSIILQQICL